MYCCVLWNDVKSLRMRFDTEIMFACAIIIFPFAYHHLSVALQFVFQHSHRVGAQFNFTVHHFDRIYTAIISSLDWFVFHLLLLFLSPTFWQNDSFDDSYFVIFVIFSNLGFRWESLMVLKIELMCSILENNAYSQYAIFSTSRQISWQMIFLLFFLSNSLLFKL